MRLKSICSSKSNLRCHAGKSPLRQDGRNNSLLTVDTDNTLTKTQGMNRKRKMVTRNSKPQKKYDLIPIWLKPGGKLDWQPIHGMKRNGKADIVNISRSIDRPKVVVEIYRDCPQQVLSNVN